MTIRIAIRGLERHCIDKVSIESDYSHTRHTSSRAPLTPMSSCTQEMHGREEVEAEALVWEW